MSHKATSTKTPIAYNFPKQTATIQKSFFDALPDSAWLREAQLVRSSASPARAIAPLPFSAPTLWRMVKAGKFPKPTKLSAGVTAWQVGQVREWMAAQPLA
jgi:predicted DNA-binding transcriptional regulator AlpA